MATDWLRYANQGATRRLPLNAQLERALGSFLPDMGVTMEVFSGGQPGKGQGPRVGSTRHDHGNAADVYFYKDGRRLDWGNPADRPVFEEVVRRGKSSGITGFGAGPGYMGQGAMHIGFGSPGVWGAGGRSANAPDWLRAAYGGPSGPVPPAPSSIVAAQQPAPPQEPGTPAPALGPGQNIGPAPVAQPQPAAPVPQSVIASAAPAEGKANMMQMLGSMAAMQPQQPQFAPVQFQGPSPQQAQALTSFIQSLRNRTA